MTESERRLAVEAFAGARCEQVFDLHYIEHVFGVKSNICLISVRSAGTV